jgi:Organic Anion Transporter Polypeptide (OATP) family
MLPAGVIGNLIGGFIIEKLRLSCRQIIKLQIVFAAITTVGILIVLIIDDKGDFAGATVPYNSRFLYQCTLRVSVKM